MDNKKDLTDLIKNQPFKTAFKATLGFYLAQTIISLLGLGLIGLVLFIIVSIIFN